MRISDWSSDVCSSDLEHVHEPAFGGRRVLILAKQADFVTDAGPTEMGDAQTGVDSVGKGEGVNKLAMRFRAQSVQRASVNVESAVPDQISDLTRVVQGKRVSARVDLRASEIL